jgi:hypothetical protein
MIGAASIQTATYTITANALAQLDALNPAVRGEALKFVMQAAEKQSATATIVINNITGLIKQFKGDSPVRLWAVGAMAVGGTAYAASKYFFPRGSGADPNALVEEQKRLAEEAKKAAEEQKLAQETLRKGQNTGAELTDSLQGEVAKQAALTGQLGSKSEIKSFLDGFNEILQEILGQLKELPAHAERVKTLDQDRALLEDLKAQCAEMKESIKAFKTEIEEEAGQARLLLEQFDAIEKQINNRG